MIENFFFKQQILFLIYIQITEWKSKHFTIETEMRTKMTDQKKLYDIKIDTLNKKVQTQQVQIAQLSKSNKRIPASVKESVKERDKDNNNSSPNNSDSPNTN